MINDTVTGRTTTKNTDKNVDKMFFLQVTHLERVAKHNWSNLECTLKYFQSRGNSTALPHVIGMSLTVVEHAGILFLDSLPEVTK